jgi:hypothetical protein
MGDTGNRDDEPAASSGGVKTKKVLVRKRKKRLGLNCDKNCPSCRVPCETPFHPTTKKPG